MTQLRAPEVPKSMPRKYNGLSACVRLVLELREVDAGGRLPAFLAMFGDHIGEDAAAHVELGGEPHEPRLRHFDQIIKYPVGNIFMKVAFLAEAPHVELQALQFDAGLVGDVVEDQCGEI